MTSLNSSSTAPSEPCESCPGGAACKLARMNPVSAYVSGCRAPIAREANTVAQRERRAQKRAQGLTGAVSEWDSPEDDPAPAPAGDDCPRCGEPLSWTPGRAGQSCPSGHFRLAPETTERAADAQRALKRDISGETVVRPSPAEIVTLDIERGRVVSACESALSELDVSELRRINEYAQTFRLIDAWSADSLRILTDGFNSLIRQARSAVTRDDLQEIFKAYQALADTPMMTNTRRVIQDCYSEAAEILTRQAQGQARFRVMPGNPNRIQKLDGNRAGLATPESIAAQQWRAQPNPVQLPRMITGRAEPDESEDEEPDDYDEEYEDEDYPRAYYTDDANGSLGTVILAVFAVVIILYGCHKGSEWWRHAGFFTCMNPDHPGRPALAREQWDGLGITIWVCHRKECRAWAHASAFRDGFPEPVSTVLADESGVPGLTFARNGRARKCKEFGGVRER